MLEKSMLFGDSPEAFSSSPAAEAADVEAGMGAAVRMPGRWRVKASRERSAMALSSSSSSGEKTLTRPPGMFTLLMAPSPYCSLMRFSF